MRLEGCTPRPSQSECNEKLFAADTQVFWPVLLEKAFLKQKETIQLPKAARGKSLLETLPSSPVSVWEIIHPIFFQHFCSYDGIGNVTFGNPEV